MMRTALTAAAGALPWRGARQLGTGLDLAISTGPRYAAQRIREQRRHASNEAAEAEAVYRGIWGDAAAVLGADLEELPGGYLEIRGDGRTTTVWRQWTMLDDAVTLRLAHDKTLVHRLLVESAVPVPRFLEFHYRDLAPALRFLEAIDGSAVVKPASGTGSGSGVTSGVRTHEDLLRARLRAARLDERILIEDQAQGEMYRLLFLEGELIGAVLRQVPRLTGDGRSSVATLIAAENRRRMSREGSMIATVDLDALFALREQGLTVRSVPPAGFTFAIKGISSQNAFEENQTVRDQLGDELIAAARTAVISVGLRVGAVDLMATDPRGSLGPVGAVILEVNGTPGLHYHYQVADPDGADRVAIPILSRLLSPARVSRTSLATQAMEDK